MSDNASPAGSSTYDSGTMYVGDGTWIASKNTFLLPNLQGLNFATMQYNSMSNRFASMPQYHQLILGHGVIAALVFLLVVPSAIFTARFYYGNPRLALRLHIWLQILTVGLLTVVFILGFSAVGPERSLTNPHHGIGVALYVLVLVQFVAGSLVHHVEKGKARQRLPLKLMLHQWVGRATALLGVAQIPLGMTLYGCPKYLFILFAVVVFGWVLVYFVLSYIHRPQMGYDDGYDSESYVSGPSRTEITDRTGHSGGHGARNAGLLGAGLAGLAAMGRGRRKDQERKSRTQVTQHGFTGVSRSNANPVSGFSGVSQPYTNPSRLDSRHSVAYTDDEKHSHNRDDERNTWRNRLLGAGAGLGAYAGFKRLFNRPNKRDEETYIGAYQAPSSVDQSVNRVDITRVQQGQAPMSPGDSRLSRPNRLDAAAMQSPTRQGLRPRRSRESFSSDDSDSSLTSYRNPHRGADEGHGVRNGIAALGVFGFLRNKQRQRRDKKEQRRVEDLRRHEHENAEHINRANSRRHGNRPVQMSRRQHSVTDTMTTNDHNITDMSTGPTRIDPPYANAPPLPASAAALPNQSTSTNRLDTAYLGYDPNPGVPPSTNTASHPPVTTPAYPVAQGAVSMPSAPMNPDPSRLVEQTQYSRTNLPQDTTAGAAIASVSQGRRSHSQQGRRNSSSYVESSHSPVTVASPPVSVKVQMHKDGRHVTLRRLNEQEAAAERDARKQERRQRRRRAESLSSGVEDGDTRFRRNEAIRPNNNIPITNVPQPPSSSRVDELNLPSPQGPFQGAPPVPTHSLSPQGASYYPAQQTASGLNSGVGSPGTWDTGTGTDLSAFDNNRRRRRAERAAAKQQRAAQQGSRVEFT